MQVERVYTYRHSTVGDPLTPFTVHTDFVFPTEGSCRTFMALCLDHFASEYVVVEGSWSDGTFTGTRIILTP